ncbi:MAG: 16S rRNA (cytosine(1407)-C(5))-methyltransferase RsmF [Shewanellaceae bacterium]|nr:16S rRNA (cytosine(1407)-C(5))-methyltransferase RsmF [Shewanellaceae bacterium]
MLKLPSHFVEYIQTILPDPLSITEFEAACQQPLRRAIRVNTLKTTIPDFLALVTSWGWQCDPIPWCEAGFWLQRPDESKPLGNTWAHLAGLFYVQEASSMLPVSALLTQQPVPYLVLDMAAAPGSKTTQIAALMQHEGCLVANEYAASRLKSLHANVQRLGVRNVALTHFDAAVFGDYCTEVFDAILLDAPCGGEGTVRKDERALADWSLDHIHELASLQQGLLESAFRALKVGGSLVYSTCTLNQIENQQVCYALKNTFGHAVVFDSLEDLFPGAERALTPEGFLHVWPQIYNSEGFFVAKITKQAPVVASSRRRRAITNKSPWQVVPHAEIQQLDAYFKTQFGCVPSEYGTVMQRQDEYWLWPNAIAAVQGLVRFDRIGIRLAKRLKKGFKAEHEAVMALPLAVDQTLALDAKAAEQYLMGRDIAMSSSFLSTEVAVSYQGAVLGLGKILPAKLKNQLPRHLVRDRIHLDG